MLVLPPKEDENTYPDSQPPASRAREPRLHAGDLVASRFVIVRFLAAGGMGEVYEAQDRFLQNSRVALKAIRSEILAIPGSLERFEREVLLARQITHPNVCPVYDIVHDQQSTGSCFISMKLLREETLLARLHREQRIAPKEAIVILRQIAAALRAAHQANVLHRDLKPGNIMLEGSGADVKAVVTDFGLAREYERDVTIASGGYILGTPGYIAPEILHGSRPTPACDLFSLGVVVHEMLTGQRPQVHPKTGHPVISPALSNSDAPKFCVDLITSCLALSTVERYRGFEQAARILNPGTRPLPAIYPTSRAISRRRWFAATSATAVAAGATLWWDWQSIGDRLHPLPAKRFVALLPWPPDTNKDVKPILGSVLDAIEMVLSRAEALDRDLFVISARDAQAATNPPLRLAQVCNSLGANLVLATSGILEARQFRLFLSVFDASSNSPLRRRELACDLSALASLPAQAVKAAALLLSIPIDDQQYQQVRQSTDSPDAFKAFQEAEELQLRPDFTGLEAAIQKYSEAIAADSRYALAYAKLAFAYCALYDVKHDEFDLELARNNSDRALKLDPKLVYAHVALSTVYEQTGDRRRALDEVAKALTLDPGNPQTLNWQAVIYQRSSRWEDAEKTLRRMVEQRPNYWLAYNQLGWLLSLQYKYAESIQAFREAAVAAPSRALVFFNLGDLYRRTGDLPQSLENMRKCVSLKEDGYDLVGLSATLRALGKYAEALQAAQKAVHLDPATDTNWAELGDCYTFLRGEQKRAFEAYFRASTELARQLHTDSDDGAGWMRLALYRLKSNRHDIVLPLVAKAERLGATDSDSQLLKLRILELSGKRADALAAAALALQKGMTPFEISCAPDLQSLRNDPGYLRLVHQLPHAAQA